MKSLETIGAIPSQGLVVVCESGQRWCDAVRRFVGPFQHAPQPPRRSSVASELADPPDREAVIVQSVAHDRVWASIAHVAPVAILWEVSPDVADASALAIAQIGVARPDCLQLIAVDGPSSRSTQALAISMTSLGVRAALRSPEELAALSPLVTRFFAKHRQQT